MKRPKVFAIAANCFSGNNLLLEQGNYLDLVRKMGTFYQEVIEECVGQDKTYLIDSSRTRGSFGRSLQVSTDGEGIHRVFWIEEHDSLMKDSSVEYNHKL